MQSNRDKKRTIIVDGVSCDRLPIKTHVITKDDDILDVVKKYAEPQVQKDDTLFVSERVVAITQGRAIKIVDIRPSPLARFLARRVYKNPSGIGLAHPATMELAIQEAGVFRILLATVVAAITKPLGIKGMFYRVAGHGVNAIDGPCDYTLPPYNEYATLGPTDPNGVARQLADAIGIPVVIIDANDLGVNVLGVSDRSIDKKWAAAVFRDNPLGQSDEQTPLCLVRMYPKQAI